MIHKNNMNHMDSNESIIVMIVSMLLAGTISGMNSFVNNRSDIRFNINDFYMSLMMIGLMFILMSVYYKSKKLFFVGLIITIITLYALRNQIFVNKNNFINSMIPHHSMAVMMSKKYLEKMDENDMEFKIFLKKIIETQENEIMFMKRNEKNI